MVPTQPGYYWCNLKTDTEATPIIVEVMQSEGALVVRMIGRVQVFQLESFTAWRGPIEN